MNENTNAPSLEKLTPQSALTVKRLFSALSENKSKQVRTAELDQQAQELALVIQGFIGRNAEELLEGWLVLHTEVVPALSGLGKLATFGAQINALAQQKKA